MILTIYKKTRKPIVERVEFGMKSTVVAVIAALSQGALAFAPAAAPAPRSGVLALRAQV